MAHGHGDGQASDWVIRWSAALPAGSTVLDLACGSGRHVRVLAQRGLAVTAVDRDAQAVAPLRELPGVAEVIVADLENEPWPLPGRRFDAVVVTNYLWRELWPKLVESLAPGGLLIYETFSIDQASIGKPSNPAFLLRHGELLELSHGLRVLGYEDGFVAQPDRFVQRIAALQPPHSALSAPPARYPL
ncbi:class I SAM-dependent methyltransferase [Piscinibacter sakaiensis]|uniref:class I SAM-dependent methyltransferase n=1 Tax=Piscinibacter sakaiensis TaxID=1547922 RepID=UPI003AB08ED0